MSHKLSKGDNVKLKGQSTVMTVIQITDWEIICAWHDPDHNYHQAVFSQSRKNCETIFPEFFTLVIV